MRWIGVWVGVGVMVVGCSRDNPGFVLNTNGDPEASTTIPAPSTGTTVPETTGSGGSAVDSGTTETTGAPGHDSSGSEGAASTSTSTGEASTGASGTSTDTGAASTSDSGSDSSSTGGPEPGEEVLPWAYDLYLRCTDANTTQWKASGNLQLFCNLGPKAPQVRQLGDMYIYDGAPREALGVEPNPVMDNEIVGYFGGISLPQEVPARLRTTLYFPAMSGGAINGQLYVKVGNQVVPETFAEIDLLPGEAFDFDIPLTDPNAAIKQAPSVTVVMVLRIDVPGDGAQGVWLDPRIVELVP